jgi:hypothetical protein
VLNNHGSDTDKLLSLQISSNLIKKVVAKIDAFILILE